MSTPNDSTLDSLLVTLASMGFDLDQGQAAIQAGKLTVHEAVEWLLQGGNRNQELSSRPTPTLSLRPSSQAQSSSSSSRDQNYLPFSMPPNSVLTDPSPPSSAVSSAEQTPTGSNDSEKVVSRFSLTDKKREEKDRWEREQREQLSAKYKEERMRKKKAHDKVLKEIEDDRKAKQLRTPSHPSPTSPTAPGAQPTMSSVVKDTPVTASSSSETPLKPSSQNVSPESKQAEDAAKGKEHTAPKPPVNCILQIRLPSGQHMRETFSSSSSLSDVITKIKEHHSSLGDNFELIQPFPRKVFSAEEVTKSLHELGLTPSGSLVVTTGSPSQAQAPGLPEDLNTGQPSSGRLPGFRSGGRIEPMPPLPPQGSQPPVHRWGQGHAVGEATGERRVEEEPREEDGEMERAGDAVAMEMEENAGERLFGRDYGDERMAVDEAGLGRGLQEDGVEDEEMEEDDGGMVDMWGQAVPPELAGIIAGGGRPGGQGFGQHVWGEGRRLDADGPGRFDYGFAQAQGEADGEGEEVAPSPARIAAAALQRLVNVAPPPPSQTSPPTERPIPTLLDMCVKCTSKRLEGHHQTGFSRLEAVPPMVAERLLTELKKSGHLRPKTLMMFVPCHLQRLALDCYKYTTNELLQTVRPHIHLSSLNLASCPLITDQGLQHITSLKKLQHLNLSNNKSLTDKVFQTLQVFSSLSTLLLEGTSVTDAGIEAFVAVPPPNLTNLSLNRTSVTDLAILFLARLSKLKNLGLEQTQVKSLEHIGHLSQLVSLNLSRNRLESDALLRLHQVPNLKVLHISHVEGITGDQALVCLQGLQLLQLSLPDRHTTTDNGLKCIAGMSLCSIDLTDYIHVTDAGIHHLADMTSLRKLTITNTKVTSAGMQYLNGLTDLLELHLDRTSVDDQGVMVIGQLNKLQVLSMAETKITDKFLLSNAINSCPHLSRLNLSRTDISDKGIIKLSLPYLTHLNLDYTCVSVDCAQNLTKCPSLKVIRTNNLRHPRVLDQN
ncbi:uncharacterized protein LOC121411442 isoform X2 [Lytechinus variegatus]|uniref:uncharacterized protein LOC121411442 isoform X2 n=1 Tax=Lytechinus variegatus TaxID=7654 RepID=UPI001BB27BC0|nr:uncharacterized protein LOC121411442 isoform X2 [Lytechinus variegatus]